MSDKDALPETESAAAARGVERRLRPGRRREPAVRYLLDSRLFRLLRTPGREEVLASFRASLVQHGFAAGSGLPALELTPLGFLEVLGIDPSSIELRPFSSNKVIQRGERAYITAVVLKLIGERLVEAPKLRLAHLTKRVETLRRATEPAALDLFDLCVTCFLARDDCGQQIYHHLAIDYLFRFPVPEVLREENVEFLCASVLATGDTVSGLSKLRSIKMVWERCHERLLRANPQAREMIQALDREMRLLRTRRDYLDWEVLHHAILGQISEQRTYPVTAFLLASEETIRMRCIAYKTALRAFLDKFSREELVKMRSMLDAWKPGTLVACREDGTFEAVVPTGDLPVFTGKGA